MQLPQTEFGQDAANNALVILETAMGWWLVRIWTGSSSQLWAEAEMWLRGFSLTTTFSNTGAFLWGLPFNYWYHQLLLGFWSYTDTVTGVTAAEKSSVWNAFPMDLNKMELSSNLVEGFSGQRERISKRLPPETKWKEPFFLALWHIHNWVVCLFF